VHGGGRYAVVLGQMELAPMRSGTKATGAGRRRPELTELGAEQERPLKSNRARVAVEHIGAEKISPRRRRRGPGVAGRTRWSSTIFSRSGTRERG
jgi:hypothetical protein